MVQLSVPHLDEEISKMKCAGTLFAPQWILTAASCRLVLLFSTRVRVVVNGESFQNGEDKSITISGSYAHEDYNHFDQRNDIALIKVKRTKFHFLHRLFYPLFSFI